MGFAKPRIWVAVLSPYSVDHHDSAHAGPGRIGPCHPRCLSHRIEEVVAKRAFKTTRPNRKAAAGGDLWFGLPEVLPKQFVLVSTPPWKEVLHILKKITFLLSVLTVFTLAMPSSYTPESPEAARQGSTAHVPAPAVQVIHSGSKKQWDQGLEIKLWNLPFYRQCAWLCLPRCLCGNPGPRGGIRRLTGRLLN